MTWKSAFNCCGRAHHVRKFAHHVAPSLTSFGRPRLRWPGFRITARCGGTIRTMVALMRRSWVVVAVAAVLGLVGVAPAMAKSSRPERFGEPVYLALGDSVAA